MSTSPLVQAIDTLNFLPDFVIVTDETGIIIEWNQRAEEIFGRRRDEMLGQSLSHQLLTSDNATKWLEHLRESLVESHYWEGEFPFELPDHSSIWAFMRAKSIVLPDERPAMLLMGTHLQGHEIRERAIWTALDFSHRELHNILSSVGDMVCKYNLFQQAIVFVSPSCFKVTGYNEFELIDTPALFLDIIHPEDRPTVEEALHHMQPNQVVNLDYRIRHKGGKTYWVRNSMTPLLDLDDTVVDVICAITDITPYYELSELKSHMIRMASHDLKHPLAIAMGYFGVLMEDLDEVLTEPQRGMVKWIGESHELMNGMLTELAELEQVETKGVLSEKIDWLPLVDKVVEQSALQIQEHRHELHFTRPEATLLVRGEGIRLHQVLFNLVSNAIKYTPDGGQIEMRVFIKEGCIYTEVRDNGAGVPADFREKLFKPFSRAKSPETAHVPGTGLGLSLVKSIIQQHGGDVFYRPETPNGSTFGFWLPRAE